MTAAPPDTPPHATHRPVTAGLLLAAGRSSRFGAADKLLAPFRGRPLVVHAAEALHAAPLDHRIAVTADPRVAALLPGFASVPMASGDPDAPRATQSDSLRAGLARARALGAELVLVVLGDMPLVTPALLAAILDRAASAGVAAAADAAVRSPPAAFGPEFFEALAATAGDRGAGAILATLPDHALVPAPGLLGDIDTAEDLARLSP
jgi:CTP:molybdopterin cytidylyltransferase MocA